MRTIVISAFVLLFLISSSLVYASQSEINLNPILNKIYTNQYYKLSNEEIDSLKTYFLNFDKVENVQEKIAYFKPSYIISRYLEDVEHVFNENDRNNHKGLLHALNTVEEYRISFVRGNKAALELCFDGNLDKLIEAQQTREELKKRKVKSTIQNPSYHNYKLDEELNGLCKYMVRRPKYLISSRQDFRKYDLFMASFLDSLIEDKIYFNYYESDDYTLIKNLREYLESLYRYEYINDLTKDDLYDLYFSLAYKYKEYFVSNYDPLKVKETLTDYELMDIEDDALRKLGILLDFCRCLLEHGEDAMAKNFTIKTMSKTPYKEFLKQYYSSKYRAQYIEFAYKSVEQNHDAK